jgi:hypothetical protein
VNDEPFLVTTAEDIPNAGQSIPESSHIPLFTTSTPSTWSSPGLMPHYPGINSDTRLEDPEVLCCRTTGPASKACENKVWVNKAESIEASSADVEGRIPCDGT